MNYPIKLLAVLTILVGVCSLAAQTTSTTSAAKDNEVVTLSPFEVSGSASVGRYSSLESTSAGRVRTDIMDSSQSISVITEELIEDIEPGRILDAAKYVAGVSESTLPTSWERTNMRGFQSEGRTVDGITYGSFGTYG
jgi:iron complex outermembrane receptor protein